MNIQTSIAQNFSELIARHRLQHAYIFSGVSGTHKLGTALYISQAILCPKPLNPGFPDVNCQVCRRIAQGQHPDVMIVRPENGIIKVDTVREVRKEFSRSGMETRNKILIIEEMDTMTISATNSLLKFLEEPESHTTIFLLTDAVQKLLPTIISRAQVINFPDLSLDERLADLKISGVSPHEAHLLAYLAADNEFSSELSEERFIFELADAAFEWVKQLAERKDAAFIYVQTHLIPKKNDQYQNRQTVQLFLDLSVLVFQDLLRIKAGHTQNLAFQKYESQLKEMALLVNYSQIADALKALLEGKKMIESHVQIQSVLEKIALDLLD